MSGEPKRFASVRFAAAVTGIIAAALQSISLGYWVFVIVPTLGLTFDAVNDVQSRLLLALPLGTLAGAIASVRFPVIGGIIMGAMAIAYSFYNVPSLSFGLDGIVSARANSLGLVGLVPACIGIGGGVFLSMRRPEPQPKRP